MWLKNDIQKSPPTNIIQWSTTTIHVAQSYPIQRPKAPRFTVYFLDFTDKDNSKT